MSRKVKEVVNTKPIMITNDATIDQAAMVMKDSNVGMLPVIHHTKNAPVGVITDRDLVMAIANGKKTDSPIGDFMSKELAYVSEEDDLEAALLLMETRHLRRIIVTDSQRRFVGLVSLSDLAKRLHGDQRYEKRIVELLAKIYETRRAI